MVNSLSGEFVWITNADKDKIVVHNGNGESVFPEINLRKLPMLIDAGNGRKVRRTTDARGGNNSASPCNIAVDSNIGYSIWKDSFNTFCIWNNIKIINKLVNKC